MTDARDVIAARAAQELRAGEIVNLGIGIPNRIPSFLDPAVEVFLHTENGLLGVGPRPQPDELDLELIDAGKKPVTLTAGAALFDSLTVAQNIKYPLREHHWGNEKKLDERVAEVLEMVGLPGSQKLKPSALSGGMRKRVGLAREIALKPEAILYDEPTTGLDPINVRRINGLILSLQKQLNVTSIVVTHDMDACFTFTDRIALLHNRRFSFVGTQDEARASDDRYLQEFIAGGKGTLDEDVE